MSTLASLFGVVFEDHGSISASHLADVLKREAMEQEPEPPCGVRVRMVRREIRRPHWWRSDALE